MKQVITESMATTGPSFSQLRAIFIMIVILILAVVCHLNKPKKPDPPAPICETNQECVIYKAQP
jgi:hypothetical protein